MTTLATPRSSGPPSVKLPNIGSYVAGQVWNFSETQATQFGTGVPLYWPDGTPKMAYILTIRATQASGAMAGKKDELTPVNPGDDVTVWLQGGDAAEWSRALKEKGSLEIGDFFAQKYERDEPSKTPGHQDRKVRTILLRSAEGDEVARVAECEQLYAANATTLAEAPRTTAPDDPFASAGGTVDPALEPF